MALTTTTGSGAQTTTQSPQSSTGGTTNNTAAGSSVQPGTATSVLTTNQGGVPLHGTDLTAVNLGTASATTVQQSPTQPAKHHVNPVLMGASVVLFCLAVALFWVPSRSSNSKA